MIAIIDYGMGNIHSVQKALESMGTETLVTNNPGEFAKCDKMVLPGVGAFEDAMSELKKQDLTEAIQAQIKRGKTFLGICLGMQLLFERSQEAQKGSKGLGILKGQVIRFSPHIGLKIPHIGWNQLHLENKECLLLKGLTDNAYVYFCHSYYPVPSNRQVIAATAHYGEDFCAVVWQENIYGVQFHPEKSQNIGLKILENFVHLC